MSTAQKAFWFAMNKGGTQNSGPKDTKEEAIAWAQNYLTQKIDCASIFIGKFEQALTRAMPAVELQDLEKNKLSADLNIVKNPSSHDRLHEAHDAAYGKPSDPVPHKKAV